MKRLTINIVFVLSFIISGNTFAQSFKFLEKFDTLGAEARGWQFVNNDSSLVEYPVLIPPFIFTNSGPLNAYSGSYFINFNSLAADDSGVIDQWIISPQINNIEKFDRLSFYCGAPDKEFKDSLRVLISVSGNSIEDFVEIDRFKVDGPAGSWHEKTYDLSQFSGSNIYFALNYLIKDGGVLGAHSDNVWIDNLSVGSAFGSDIEVETYDLEQNYPNPFNPSTNIVFSIPFDSKVQIKIYDVLGQEIETIVNSNFNSGRYKILWNGLNYASGTYFYTINATSGNNSFEDTKQMILVK